MKKDELIKNINAYYAGTGYNISDLMEYVKKLNHSGYDISYDGSMAFFYFKDVNVLISPSNVSYFENTKIIN